MKAFLSLRNIKYGAELSSDFVDSVACMLSEFGGCHPKINHQRSETYLA